MTIFVGVIWPPPLDNLDEDLEVCLERVNFLCLCVLSVIVPALINCSFSQVQALALSEKQCEARAVESAQAAKNAKLEVLTKSQADKITKLEIACTDLQREKDTVTSGYRRFATKHNAFMVKVEQDKTKMVEAHVAELAKLCRDLDLEMRSYIEYRQTVRRRHHELHEIGASSFSEVRVQCLLFHVKGVKVEEMINWVVGEVKVVSNTA
jgi:hypothetical protein